MSFSKDKMSKTYEFETIADLHQIPLEKIPALCEDLKLWLSVVRLAEMENPPMTVKNRDVFSWVDDNRHVVDLRINIKMAREDEPTKPKG